MAALVEAMGRRGLLAGDALAAATQAARLAKADLVTLMVREFPELQGTMGGIYLAGEGALRARGDGRALALPPGRGRSGRRARRGLHGPDEAARVFAAVALADKLDTLAGYFGIGENPTGSRDPYGLRRAGQGAVRAVLDFWRPKPGEKAPDLEALVAAAVAGYPPLKQPADATTRNVQAFLLDRLEYVLSARGFASDEVAAVVHAPDLARRSPTRSLRPGPRRSAPAREARGSGGLRRPGRGLQAREEHRRAGRRPPRPSTPSLFDADAERALFADASRLQQAKGSYEDRLRGLATLRAPVARFFDDVLVMAEDPRVRANRLALLQQTLSLFYQIADISRLGGTS